MHFVIITITAGVSISKRETVAKCQDPSYTYFEGSWCKTLTSMNVLCSNAKNGNVRVRKLSEQSCNPDEHCVDFLLNDEVQNAMCVPYQSTIGFTTYGTNGQPIQVYKAYGNVNYQAQSLRKIQDMLMKADANAYIVLLSTIGKGAQVEDIEPVILQN
ncbi:hypothetical protein C1646_772590 [Rhizophagus diaphanus]|nr:hypothetical protein C1646_772590 [Rhizophagus diaphanus] [Rhizophagus sp. MUCL 43196]